MDFTAQTLRPTFLSGQIQQRLCYDIDIINDQLLEGNEVFQVLLTSDDSDLNFSPNSATVTIIDNNSEYYIIIHSVVLTFVHFLQLSQFVLNRQIMYLKKVVWPATLFVHYHLEQMK